jgi:hypothetical protein
MSSDESHKTEVAILGLAFLVVISMLTASREIDRLSRRIDVLEHPMPQPIAGLCQHIPCELGGKRFMDGVLYQWNGHNWEPAAPAPTQEGK